MATGKRYYWLKLKESFMTSDTVDFLMSQKDGANYVVLYQMLCLKTINTEGRLSRTIGEIVIPYDVSKIQRDCKWFSLDTIRVALELYKRFGLVYEDQDGTLVLANHDEMVGSETDWASQKYAQRLKKPKEELLPASCESGVENVHTDVHDNVRTNVHTDIRDKILDIRDKENRGEDTQIESLSAVPRTAGDSEKKTRKPKPRIRETDNPMFNRFYKAYPKHISGDYARKCFERIDPDEELLETMLAAIERQKKTEQWQNIRYIPNPSTWLNERKWTDEIPDDYLVGHSQKKQWNPNQPKSHYKPDGSYDYEAGQSKELESF